MHYAGVGCEMDAILDDRARGTASPSSRTTPTASSARYRGQPLGTFGALATQSFHETKNINCGEGGALVINDPALVERAEIIREKGTNRSRFFRGQVDKYTWVDVGSSYLPSDMLAAYPARRSSSRRETIQAKRRRVWERYAAALAGLGGASTACALPVVPRALRAAVPHVLPAASRRSTSAPVDDRAPRGARASRPSSTTCRCNASEMGSALRRRAPATARSRRASSDRLLRLPFYNNLAGRRAGPRDRGDARHGGGETGGR